jgi:hypothetical protein
MKKYFYAIVALALLAPVSALADILEYQNPFGDTIKTIPEFLKGLLGVIVKIGIPVSVIFLVWAGFMFVTAGGDEKKIQSAKKTFVWTCIGIGILLGSWLLAVGYGEILGNIMGTP